jgi:dolichyl-diphosphooligosaccharide--protein glycosyltransferase
MGGAGATGKSRFAVPLCLIVAAAFAMRGLYVDIAFPPGGEVVFNLDDASYHLRRALYSFVNFPAVLCFDPYLNYPAGSPVPWPPLFDWLIAAVARTFGDSLEVFERTAAWSAPVAGALTALPVYAIGRALAGPGLGLGAAAIFALLPAAVFPARVGNPDHHAFVSLLGATWLALSVAAVRREAHGRTLRRLCAGLLAVRALLLLSWSGSLLYIALADGSLLLIAVLGNRRDLLIGQALGALGAGALVAPWIWAAGTPTGGFFSTITLSWFHVVALVGVAFVAGSVAWLESLRPSASALVRVLRAGVLTALALGLLFAFPAPRQALLPTASFLTKTDAWGATVNLEGRALFGPELRGRFPGAKPYLWYGWFAYLIPLAGLALLARMRRRPVREPAACAALWALLLGTLAVGEVRFGSDFAPVASVAFALLISEVCAPLGRATGAPKLANAAALLLAVAALWPPLTQSYAPKLPHLRARLSESAERADTGALGSAQSLLRFGRSVREVTPETRGYLDATRTPEYGILVRPSLGHGFRYASRRALPADNFGPYLDDARFALARSFFTTASPTEAVDIARELGTRFVVTAASYALWPPARGRRLRNPGIARRLHSDDGSAHGGLPHLERFRLITEGPENGVPLFPIGRKVVPYKLFEIVPGAVLEARAEPGTRLSAEVVVTTPLGRRFRYRAATRAGEDGVARLRVPYATDSEAPVRTEGAYQVRLGEQRTRTQIADRDVREGGVIRLEAVSAGPPG